MNEFKIGDEVRMESFNGSELRIGDEVIFVRGIHEKVPMNGTYIISGMANNRIWFTKDGSTINAIYRKADNNRFKLVSCELFSHDDSFPMYIFVYLKSEYKRRMTVGDLMSKLSYFDANVEVVIHQENSNYGYEIKDVRTDIFSKKVTKVSLIYNT